MKGDRGTKEKRVCVSQRAQTKGNQFRQESLVNLRDPHYVNSRQGLLSSSGVEHQEWLRWTRRDPSQICKNFGSFPFR